MSYYRTYVLFYIYVSYSIPNSWSLLNEHVEPPMVHNDLNRPQSGNKSASDAFVPTCDHCWFMGGWTSSQLRAMEELCENQGIPRIAWLWKNPLVHTIASKLAASFLGHLHTVLECVQQYCPLGKIEGRLDIPCLTFTYWMQHTMELAHSSRAKELFNQQEATNCYVFRPPKGLIWQLPRDRNRGPSCSKWWFPHACKNGLIWLHVVFYAYKKPGPYPPPWPGSAQPIGSKIFTKQIGLNPERKHGTHSLLKARLDYMPMSLRSNIDAPFVQRGSESLFEEELSVTWSSRTSMSTQFLKRLACKDFCIRSVVSSFLKLDQEKR